MLLQIAVHFEAGLQIVPDVADPSFLQILIEVGAVSRVSACYCGRRCRPGLSCWSVSAIASLMHPCTSKISRPGILTRLDFGG